LLPDLLIVDGGKGQLSRACKILEEHNLTKRVPVVGLAKGHEELYLPNKSDPVILPRRSQGLYLVQRIRDEAHRFALRQHRTQRRRGGLASKLDSINGVGPARRKALLKTFGDIEGIRQASIEELAGISGITSKTAEQIQESLTG